jgi:hypothetical protein
MRCRAILVWIDKTAEKNDLGLTQLACALLWWRLCKSCGEGGKYLAWHMAQAGCRAAVVERQGMGGSCPNINCLPGKNEIWSAKVADLVHHVAKFGMVTGPTAIDMAGVRQRKRAMVHGLISMPVNRYQASGTDHRRKQRHWFGHGTTVRR